MNEEIVEKWIKKANNDLLVASHQMTLSEPVTEAVCFHAQQCIEKYLKAFIIFHNKTVGKTHNIAMLVNLCGEIDQQFLSLLEMNIDDLTAYAVEIRYPDDFYFPDREEASIALEQAVCVKDFILKKLGSNFFA